MAQCKQSPQEFIQDAFSPMIAVLSSHDAELVCQKNNLSFVELIQPFCRLNTEAHIRDPGNASHTVRNLKVTLRDFNQTAPQPTLAKKTLNDAVGNSLPSNAAGNNCTNVMSVGDYDLQISSSTPWYESFREAFLQITFPSDHEFIRHFLACVFVVSSSHADPMDQFSRLTQQQSLQQSHNASKGPKWFCANILRYYVLIHDVMDEEETKAEAIYQSMKTAYGINNCHLLQINSTKASSQLITSGMKDSMPLPDPWSQFVTKKQNNDYEYEGGVPVDGDSFPNKVTEGTNSTMPPPEVESGVEITEDMLDNKLPPSTSLEIDHPLSASSNNIADHTSDLTDTHNNILPRSNTSGGISDKPGVRGACLTLSDHDRLRIFIHEFIVRGLIPWAERTLRILNDQVVTKKGIHKSLFSATKKWFGNKPSSPSVTAEKTNVVYTPEAPEMQMRRLADLSFMFQLYEIAYQTYHTAKRDFNNDHAWFHHAGSLEMLCMSIFMQGNASQRQYPLHYMDTSVNAYLNTCRAPTFATRATLLSTEALKSKNLYAEAASQFIKMTSEDSDLRSALLLEQASHCFIRMKQPMVRKYAFHMILAGHRFTKAGQRRHALRSYSQALQVYKGKNWTLAEGTVHMYLFDPGLAIGKLDHINFTLGRQSFNLKQLDNAVSAFKHLLSDNSRQSPPQQNAFLREYLFVYKQQLTQMLAENGGNSTTKELPQLTLPLVDGNATKILLSKLATPMIGGRKLASGVNFYSDESQNEMWEKLEKLIVVNKTGSLPFNFKPTIQCFTNRTKNSSNPLAVIHESLTVEVTLVNPLKITLALTDVVLLWRFIFTSSGTQTPPPIISNEGEAIKNKIAEEMVHSQVIPEIVLEGSERKQIHLQLVPKHMGELYITGVAFNLGSSSQATQDTTSPLATQATNFGSNTLSVRGKVNLEVQGPRLNNTKEERVAKMYGPDRRLDLVITQQMPLLQVIFCDCPTSLLCAEVRQISVEFTNTGPTPLTGLKVSSTNPEFFTFGDPDAISSMDHVYPNIPQAADGTEYMCEACAVKYVQSLSLPNGRLDPGQVVKLPLWIRGPDVSGMKTVHMLFLYETTDSQAKVRHRVVRHSIPLRVDPSLVLHAQATRGHSTMTNDKQLNNINVSLQVENINQLQGEKVSEFNLLQVSCASRRWRLDHLSTQKHSDIRIRGQESTSMCFKGQKLKRKLDSEGSMVLSNVVFDQLAIDSSAAPCKDFYDRSKTLPSFNDVEVEALKPAMMPIQRFVENIYEPLDDSLCVNLSLIVIWKANVNLVQGGHRVVTGQHHITISTVNSPVTQPIIHKQLAVESPPVKLLKDPEIVSNPIPTEHTMSQLLKYCLKYTPQVQHNFNNSRVCQVQIEINLCNCSQSSLAVSLLTQQHGNSSGDNEEQPSPDHPEASVSSFTWTGLSSTATPLSEGTTQTLTVSATFLQPGVYSLSNLHVLAAPDSHKLIGKFEPTRQRQNCPYFIVVTNTASS